MKNIFLTSVLCFILTLVAIGQTDLPPDAPEKAIPRVKAEYDKFNDRTHIRSEKVSLTSDRYPILFPDVTISGVCSFEGKEPKGTPILLLVVMSRSSNWNFLKYHNGIVLADSSRIALGEGDRSGDLNTGGRSVSVTEWIYYGISQGDLATIAKAKKVEAQFGSMETVVPDTAQLALKDLLTACTAK